MIRRPPRSTRTDTLFPDTTLFRSRRVEIRWRLGVALFESGDLDRWEAAVVAGLEAAEREHDDRSQWRLRLDEREIAFWRRPGSVDPEDSLRSEERRVGKEVVSTARSLWLADT